MAEIKGYHFSEALLNQLELHKSQKYMNTLYHKEIFTDWWAGWSKLRKKQLQIILTIVEIAKNWNISQVCWTLSTVQFEGGSSFNIWYNEWRGVKLSGVQRWRIKKIKSGHVYCLMSVSSWEIFPLVRRPSMLNKYSKPDRPQTEV